MKTAISIPDKLFIQADELARQLGLSRSELYVKAIEEFIKEQDDDLITEKLNEIYDENSSNLDKSFFDAQMNSINNGDTW